MSYKFTTLTGLLGFSTYTRPPVVAGRITTAATSIAPKTFVKPSLWAITPALVTPEWQWFWKEDIRFAFILWEGKATPIELLSGVKTTVFSGTPGWTSNTRGVATEINSTDGWQLAHNPDHNILGEITLLWAGIVDTGSSFNHFMGKHLSNGIVNTPFDFRTNNAAPPAQVLGRAGSSGGARLFNGQNITLGKFQVHGVSQSGIITDTPRFYLDGISSAGTAGGGGGTGAPTGNTDTLKFGRRTDGGVQLDGQQSIVVGIGSIWTDARHKQFAEDPFGPFRRGL